ncbi:MAG: hypothetical protein C0481_18155 [Phenylobacterium sp.]|uniref:hypothetical protein n=1 Tax=Phenylobacterium sp. TaxID=1871053 RepID=UPI0025DF0610|nr:hypothetical protein [Phenylobacterium sp.]MBA4013789.1 hypothetical protein [Phenylobacterium sp.]
MSVSSVGPASWYAQPQFAAPAGKAKESDDTAGKLLIEEPAKPDRTLTPEEEEKLKKTLAGMAAGDFQKILEEDAQRAADKRAAQGRDPAGAVVDLRV